MNYLLQFSYLQLLDLMTTWAFLALGVQEGNPLVRYALATTSHPVGGLLLVKVLAIGVGIYCWRLGRMGLLFRANILFALLVTWNLAVIILVAKPTI